MFTVQLSVKKIIAYQKSQYVAGSARGIFKLVIIEKIKPIFVQGSARGSIEMKEKEQKIKK